MPQHTSASLECASQYKNLLTTPNYLQILTISMNLVLLLICASLAQSLALWLSHRPYSVNSNGMTSKSAPQEKLPENPPTDHLRLTNNLRNAGMVLGLVTLALTAVDYLLRLLPLSVRNSITVHRNATETVTVTPRTVLVIQTLRVIVGPTFTSTIGEMITLA